MPQFACATSAFAIEDYLSTMSAVFSSYRPFAVPDVTVTVVDSAERLRDNCGPAVGCVANASVYLSRTSWNTHEFAHALAVDMGRSSALIEEGLAIYLEPGAFVQDPIDKNLPIEDYFVSADLTVLRREDVARYTAMTYAAADFIAYVARNAGWNAVLGLYDALDWNSSSAEVDAAFAASTGVDLADAIADWRGSASPTLTGASSESFGCHTPALAEGVALPLNCGVLPLYEAEGNTGGRIFSLAANERAEVSLRFPTGSWIASSALIPCASGDSAAPLSSISEGVIEHVRVLEPGAQFVELQAGAARPGAAPGPMTFDYRNVTVDASGACSVPVHELTSPMVLDYVSSTVHATHPLFGHADVVAVRATTTVNVSIDPDVRNLVEVCGTTCDQAADCTSFATLAGATGRATLFADTTYYLVVPAASGGSRTRLRLTVD